VERHRAPRATTLGDVPTDIETPAAGEHVTTGSQFSYGMRNAAMTYASSVSTNIASEDHVWF
jgi:hypothetical protein